MTDRELAQIVQNHTGFPWFNGKAYVDFHGIGFKAENFRLQQGVLIDDLSDVMELLREEKVYWASDRLRELIERIKDTPGN